MLVALFFLTTAGSSEENKFTNIKYLGVFSNSLSIKEHSSEESVHFRIYYPWGITSNTIR